jgi:hypothetical protein
MQSRSTPISVRQAKPDDTELISTLSVDVQAIHAAALPERFKRPGPTSFTTAETHNLLAKADNIVFLAFAHSAPAGYAYAEIIRARSSVDTGLRTTSNGSGGSQDRVVSD